MREILYCVHWGNLLKYSSQSPSWRFENPCLVFLASFFFVVEPEYSSGPHKVILLFMLSPSYTIPSLALLLGCTSFLYQPSQALLPKKLLMPHFCSDVTFSYGENARNMIFFRNEDVFFSYKKETFTLYHYLEFSLFYHKIGGSTFTQ